MISTLSPSVPINSLSSVVVDVGTLLLFILLFFHQIFTSPLMLDCGASGTGTTPTTTTQKPTTTTLRPTTTRRQPTTTAKPCIVDFPSFLPISTHVDILLLLLLWYRKQQYQWPQFTHNILTIRDCFLTGKSSIEIRYNSSIRLHYSDVGNFVRWITVLCVVNKILIKPFF